jgi:hypothetical protein
MGLPPYSKYFYSDNCNPLKFPENCFLFKIGNTRQNTMHMNDVKNQNIQNDYDSKKRYKISP